jgi:3-isopropylmalate/(R)-2-methylmalate dehydratase small subunit
MAGWRVHRGQAVALPLDNLDTDQLIPARFMSQPRAEGYGGFLLHDLRRDPAGQPDPGFPLNRHPGASILVAGRNFGSGSSREAAVYALVDAGIRAVVAPGFGDIFAANAVNNGLLPARVTAADIAALTSALDGGAAEATVDLETGTITLGDLAIGFVLDEIWRTKLVNGWDDIDLTGRHAEDIARFRAARRQTAPWAWPRGAA